MDFSIETRASNRGATPRCVRSLAACALLIALSGCVLTTKYERPIIDVPAEFRWKDAAPIAASTSNTAPAPEKTEAPASKDAANAQSIPSKTAAQPSTSAQTPSISSAPKDAAKATAGVSTVQSTPAPVNQPPCELLCSCSDRNGAWWKVFKDAKLDEIEQTAFDANQNVYAAVARIDEARALARVARADFFPQITTDPSFMRSADSARTYSVTAGGFGNFGSSFARHPRNDFLLPINYSWELDVFGRIKHTEKAALERAEASVADYQAVLLTVSTDVATSYFQLRELDLETEVLKRNRTLREELLTIVDSRFKFGATDAVDIARTKSDIATIAAALADVKRQREQAANALAILTGTPASNFNLEHMPLAKLPPKIPTGLPSSLLERRPDVIENERLLAATCDDITVARAAFLPRFALTGGGGFESQNLGDLVHGQSTLWNVVANMSAPLFTGGHNKAELEAARARI